MGHDPLAEVQILIERATTGTTAFTMGAQVVAPGGEVPPHKHAHEEILFVYAGTGRITVGGVPHEVAPETAVFVPADAEHRIDPPAAGAQPTSPRTGNSHLHFDHCGGNLGDPANRREVKA